MILPIQTSITGYSGTPCTLFSLYDTEGQVLTVGAMGSYRREPREGYFVIVNNSDLERNSLFIEDQLKESISAFFNMESGVSVDGKTSRLVYLEQAASANPRSKLEKDGIDANGQKYRIAEDVTNAQIATLATALYAESRAGNAQKIVDMADELMAIDNFFNSGIVTI